MPDGRRPPRLVAEGLERHYAGRAGVVCAIDGISFTIGHDETLGIVGESGSGKSTLARLIVRLEQPTGGRLSMDGEDVVALAGERLRRWRKHVQIVLQDPHNSLSPHMRVIDQVIEGWKVHPEVCPPAERRDRAMALLRSVGLTPEHARVLPRQLSGGQRQRVSIARALALEPSLLVCDEPVSALDVSIQAQILNILRDIREKLKISCVFISHDLAVIRYIADRVAVMYLGRIVEIGRTEEVYTRPRHPYTVALLSAEPAPHFDGSRQRIRLTGEVPSPLNVPPGCRFHTRCWKAKDICRSLEPKLAGSEQAQAAACHFPENAESSPPAVRSHAQA
jgi:oligopeptide/dipeptide ABC transporter ATP-binding protein